MATGVMAILGIIALKFIFGVFGGLVGLFFVLFFLALKIAFIGLIVYVALRIFMPSTADKIKEKATGA
jgi:phage shock protein PspC (stress-responsive transcriptional regulator)